MYLALKTVHIIAVILFLGNIITGLFWKSHADRTRDPRYIAHTFEGIIRSDRIFTVPGVVLITAAGIWAAVEGGFPLFRTGWILWSIILFSASGVAFMARVAPLQRDLLDIARSPGPDGMDWSLYHAKSRAWELWGFFATVTPLIAVVLMIAKYPA